MKKEKVKKLGKMGTFKVTPLKDVNVQFDICYQDSVISNYYFTTGEGGKFLLEIEDFYGKKYAALTPALNFNQVQDKDSIFKFSLDKYFSPKFRLYDYWQQNIGCVINLIFHPIIVWRVNVAHILRILPLVHKVEANLAFGRQCGTTFILL